MKIGDRMTYDIVVTGFSAQGKRLGAAQGKVKLQVRKGFKQGAVPAGIEKTFNVTEQLEVGSGPSGQITWEGQDADGAIYFLGRLDEGKEWALVTDKKLMLDVPAVLEEGKSWQYTMRLSDGKTTGFTSLTDPSLQNIDGLTFNLTGAGAAGERILFKPFADAAANIKALVNSPRDLAAANPINAAMGTSNGGTLQLSELKATGLPNPPGLVLPPNGDTATPPAFPGGIQLQFTAGPPATYDVINRGSAPPTTVATGQSYVAGQPISINGWSITLQGTPKSGDTVNIGNATDPLYGDIYTRNAGNASALMALRDVKMFDESKLSDGYAGLMAQNGTRTQSASYAAELSNSIASNLEADRTAVSGVNLDEEAARLIQYQQAYQASAKMLQIAQNIFDNLIQSMGR